MLIQDKKNDADGMSGRMDFEPVFFAPFVSTVMTVDSDWIDYNGHLNMAYYNVLIDRAVDEAFLLVGLGPDYIRERGASFFTAEAHVRYLRELKAGDPVRVTIRLIDYDEKRLHIYASCIMRSKAGFRPLPSSSRCTSIPRREGSCPSPTTCSIRLAPMKSAHGSLPLPDAIGRRIAMPANS